MDAHEPHNLEALDLEAWATRLMDAAPEDIDRVLSTYRREARTAELPEVRKLARQRVKAIKDLLK